MNSLSPEINADIARVSHLSIVPAILEAVCKATGMGFAAIARVTTEKWVACSVRDEIKFGLLPGGELKLETTICHEIRQSGEGVIIDHVAQDECYATHHTPTMYGFQSYISLPIVCADGSFFGTLCAIDPSPAILNNPAIIGMFKRFAALLSVHLGAAGQLSGAAVGELEARTNLALLSLIETLPTKEKPITREQLVETLAQSAGKMDGLILQLQALVKPGLGVQL